jgi:Holliday junction DNA helicase RuvA
MIASLEGRVTEKLNDYIIVDVRGVGYGVFVSLEDYSKIEVNQDSKFLIYEYVREQAHDLFGFLERNTQNLFEKLLDVNGVGPKMALNMLSIGPVEKIKEAISSGDIKYLQQANGVGRRVAERVVVELREKVGLGVSDFTTEDLINMDNSSSKDEAVQALIALGYASNDALNSLKAIDKSLSTEERIKQALKRI